MNSAAASSDTAPVSLTRSQDEAPVFPGLGPVGERFGRSLSDLLARFGFGENHVRAGAPLMTDVGTWQSGRSAQDALVRFQMSPMKGGMLLSVPAKLVIQLVDRFFGGDGIFTASNKDFSPAELRLLKRLGEACLPLLAAAWKDVLAIEPQLMAMEPDGRIPALGNPLEQIAVQPFAVSGSDGHFEIQCVFQQSALRPVVGLKTVCATATADPVDEAWQLQIEEAVMQVRLPVRSVFARPEMSLTKLLSLKEGDLIPILMPRHVPVSIGERLFAHGSVGESNGRTAIKIETLL